MPPPNHLGNWGMPPETPPTGQAIPSAAPVGMQRASEPPSQDGGNMQRRREHDLQAGKCMLTDRRQAT